MSSKYNSQSAGCKCSVFKARHFVPFACFCDYHRLRVIFSVMPRLPRSMFHLTSRSPGSVPV